METLKQAAITAISQLPDTATFNDIQSILEPLKSNIPVEEEPISFNKTDDTEEKPVSCLDLMKDYIGCSEGPEDLSTNKAYMKGYGL